MKPKTSKVDCLQNDDEDIKRYGNYVITLTLLTIGAWFTVYNNFVAGELSLLLQADGVIAPQGGHAWISGLGLFMASFPLGMLFGTLFLGRICDSIGRRPAYAAMVLLFSLASLLGGLGYTILKPSLGPVGSVWLLMFARFVAGLGVGGQIVILDVYVTEAVPDKIRGFSMAILQAIAFTAIPTSSALASWIAPASAPEKWWIIMVFGSMGALFVLPFVRYLPESSSWLACESNEMSNSGETRVIQRPSIAEQIAQSRRAIKLIFSPYYRWRTVMLMVFHCLWPAGYYGFLLWLPTLMRAKGLTIEDSLSIQSMSSLFAPIGPVIAIWTIERYERKSLIASLSIAICTTLVLIGFLTAPLSLVLVASATAICCNWFCCAFHVYQSELFPTIVRGTGVGFCFTWSRVSIVFLNLVIPLAIESGFPVAIAVMAVPMFFMAILIGGFGPRTNNIPLEELSPIH